MAQFVFESDLHSLLQLDTPIPNAPPARWQRKAKEAGGPGPSPMRAANRSHSAGRTPGRTPGKSGKGSAKGPTTPSKPGGDRYIPQRSASQMEVASFLLSKENQQENDETPTRKVSRGPREEREHLGGGRALAWHAQGPQGGSNPIWHPMPLECWWVWPQETKTER